MGLFCKGLHCAGCGKGFPAGIVLAIIALAAIGSRHADRWIGRFFGEAAVILAILVPVILIVSALVLKLIIRVFSPVVCVRIPANKVTYSQMKFLETGDTEWLELTGGMPEVRHVKSYVVAGNPAIPVPDRRTP